FVNAFFDALLFDVLDLLIVHELCVQQFDLLVPLVQLEISEHRVLHQGITLVSSRHFARLPTGSRGLYKGFLCWAVEYLLRGYIEYRRRRILQAERESITPSQP